MEKEFKQRKYNYNPKNPLIAYYDKMEVSGNKWRVLSAMTKMPLQTLIKISRAQPHDVEKMWVGTYLQLKKTIGVDMTTYIE